jgi:hypothetical protein
LKGDPFVLVLALLSLCRPHFKYLKVGNPLPIMISVA